MSWRVTARLLLAGALALMTTTFTVLDLADGQRADVELRYVTEVR